MLRINFIIDTNSNLLYFSRPRSPEERLQAKTDVNGERRLRPRFAAVVPGVLGGQPPGPLRSPGSMSLNSPGSRNAWTPGQGKWGTKDLKTPRWSAVRRDRSSQSRRVLPFESTPHEMRRTALRSLFWRERNREETKGNSRGNIRSRGREKTWLFDNWIGCVDSSRHPEVPARNRVSKDAVGLMVRRAALQRSSHEDLSFARATCGGATLTATCAI